MHPQGKCTSKIYSSFATGFAFVLEMLYCFSFESPVKNSIWSRFYCFRSLEKPKRFSKPNRALVSFRFFLYYTYCYKSVECMAMAKYND